MGYLIVKTAWYYGH